MRECFHLSLILLSLPNSCQPVFLTVWKRNLPASHLSGLTDCPWRGGREGGKEGAHPYGSPRQGKFLHSSRNQCFISSLIPLSCCSSQSFQ